MGEVMRSDADVVDAIDRIAQRWGVEDEHDPDYVGDIRELPQDQTFDAVMAFEVLQHMPYSESLELFETMRLFSSRYVAISLPIRRHRFSLRLQLPRAITRRRFGLASLRDGKEPTLQSEWPRTSDIAVIDRETHGNRHYWELGRKSYPTSRLISDLENAGVRLIERFGNPAHSYQEFLIFERV